jgi:magnesium transporter
VTRNGAENRLYFEFATEPVEDCILAETYTQSRVGRLYQLRRDLLRLRNAAIPLVEVCRRLEQPGLPGIDIGM